MSEKLKPCPLCGGEAEHDYGMPYEWPENIRCANQDCGFQTVYDSGTDWNALPRRDEIKRARREAFEECIRIAEENSISWAHDSHILGPICARLAELEKEKP